MYYRHTHYGISQRRCVLYCTISFSLWRTMVKMAICTPKCEQKWLKINRGGGVGGLEWRCPGWKKIEKLTIRRGGTIILDLRVIESSSHITCSTILLNAMSHLLFASFNDLFSSSFTFYFVFFFALFEIKICTYYQKCYFTFVVFHNDA